MLDIGIGNKIKYNKGTYVMNYINNNNQTTR